MNELQDILRAGTVHLCVDMQRLFSRDGPWPTPWMERVLPRVVRLTQHAPERTVFTRFLTPATAEDMPGSWQLYYRKWTNVTRERIDAALFDLMPELQPYAPPATVFDKYVYSAFFDGKLATFLRHRKVHTLIVSGSETDVCVLSSVLAAIDRGFRVVVVRDAVCSSSDESHDALIELYNTRFSMQVTLADFDDILAAWHI